MIGSADIDIRVHPKSGRNAVEVSGDGTVRVRVTAAAERGRANEAAARLLAKRLGVSKSRVSIVRGHASRDKVVRIHGMESGETARRLRP